jgi:hypothetical protein
MEGMARLMPGGVVGLLRLRQQKSQGGEKMKKFLATAVAASNVGRRRWPTLSGRTHPQPKPHMQLPLGIGLSETTSGKASMSRRSTIATAIIGLCGPRMPAATL